MYIIILILILLFSIVILIKLEIKRERKLCCIKNVNIKSNKIKSDYTFLYVSDFHNSDNNMCLTKVSEVLKDENIKDVICGGDMITYSPKRKTGLLYINFLKLLDIIKKYNKKFYFGYGNHENRLELIRNKFQNDINDLDNYEKDIKNYELQILDDNNVVINNNIKLYEIKLTIEYYKKDLFYKNIKKRLDKDTIKKHVGELDNNYYNIILCHNPDYSENLIEYGFDLVLSGHQHGGLVRLPLIGSVFSPETTIFPPYNKGHYVYKNKDIIVSAGMGEHTIKVRLNNLPEIYKISILGE